MHFLIQAYCCEEECAEVKVRSFLEMTRKYKYQRKTSSLGKREDFILDNRLDNFFSTHPSVKKSIKRLKPRLNKYSSEIIQMFYCHFLIKNWYQYKEESLHYFLCQYVDALKSNTVVSPTIVNRMLYGYDIGELIKAYSSIVGFHQALNLYFGEKFKGGQLILSMEDLIGNYSEFYIDFSEFVKDLKMEFVLGKTLIY